MAESRLAAPESVADFPDFYLILPHFAGLVVKDIFLKEFKIKI